MSLTRQQRLEKYDDDKFPTVQLFILALVRLAEPIALTSIFPYAWQLVLFFKIGDEQNAAFYAGILISAFSLAEACSGMYWGSLSDKIGRKPVLLLGCIWTMISLLIVGFAPNFWIALLGRLIGGGFNGNIGIIQTMVGELCKKKEHEPQAYSVMPFVWSIGTIIGPSIGGYFAAPATNFPSVFSPTGIFSRFPYALPNIICAFLMLLSILAGYFFLMETHPDLQPWSTKADLDNTTAETPLMPTAGATAHAAADLSHPSYGTFDAVDIQPNENWNVRPDGRPTSISSGSSAQKEKVFTRPVIMLVIALAIFTWHSMGYDLLLPIYSQDKWVDSSSMAGGLGMTTQEVGMVMSVNGIIALFMQAVVFPLLASWMGVWRLFILVTVGHPIAYFIVPYLSYLPTKDWLYTGLYGCLTVRNFFSILAYPILLILIKEASPSPSCLGKINGLAASTGAACRMIASPLVGFLYGVGGKMEFTALAWWVCALVALIGAFQLPLIERNKDKTATVSSAVPCRLMAEEPTPAPKDVIRVSVEEMFEEV